MTDWITPIWARSKQNGITRAASWREWSLYPALPSHPIPTPPALALDDDSLRNAPGEVDEPCSGWGEED